MTIAMGPRDRPRIVTETAQRRWRLAALLGLVVLLAMAGYVIVTLAQNAQANRTVAVLKATQDIRAGTTISANELGVSYLRVDDASVLASLVSAGDRDQLVGQVATDDVRAGALLPAGLATPEAGAGMWEVPLPVRRKPPGLKPGDRVALVVSATAKTGEPVEFVAMQDVRVLGVGTDSVDLWLPAAATAQMQWYADHGGGIVVARMPAGVVQQDLPAGGGS
jgi:hypothetical protein